MPEDVGINKPFDRIMKSFADEAPRLLLHLLGIASLDAEVEIGAVRPETAPPVSLPDLVLLLKLADRPKFIFHCEFLLFYVARAIADVARYGGSLAQQHLLEVVSVLILLRREGVPREFPEFAEYRVGTTRVLHPFHVARMWELDPAAVLATKDPRLFPWAVLMKSTDEQVREIGKFVSEQGDEEAIGRFLTLGSVRYDRGELESMIGGTGMGLTEAIMETRSRMAALAHWALRQTSKKTIQTRLSK